MSELTMCVRGQRYTVRPMLEADGQQVIEAFEHLSDSSRRSRFLSPVPRIHSTIAADLTRVDDQRIVLLAFDDTGALVAEARAVRCAGDPSTAEIAVTVLDEHQHRGLGPRLLRRLGAASRRAGVKRFVGHVLVDNAAAQALLRSAGATRRLVEPGIYGFEIPLLPNPARHTGAAAPATRMAS